MALGNVSRTNMIKGQLLPGNVLDERLLSALQAVPRELCVPQALQGSAYVDEDLPVGEGRYMMQPLVFSKLLELAEIGYDDQVMIIGGGTGYSAAVISQLCRKVIAVEEQGELAEKARQFLNKLQIRNAEVITGALSLGYSVAKPFNVIVIEGAVQQIPSGLKEQLADGGRLVAVENIARRADAQAGLGKLLLIRKDGNQFYERRTMDANIPILPGFEAKSRFQF